MDNNYNLEINSKTPCPETHLAKSIVLTILLCWPLGIPAIVNAAGVSSAYIAGNYELAKQKSENARKWCKRCIIGGIIFWVIYMIFIVVYLIGITALVLEYAMC